MATVKAKEKEMKEEKEAERQVSKQSLTVYLITYWPPSSEEYKRLKTSVLRKKRGNVSRSWPRPCIRNESTDWREKRRETRCWNLEHTPCDWSIQAIYHQSLHAGVLIYEGILSQPHTKAGTCWCCPSPRPVSHKFLAIRFSLPLAMMKKMSYSYPCLNHPCWFFKIN